MADTTTTQAPGTTTQSLASWASPYIGDYLGKSWALSEQPYQTYQGPLTAGASQLQTQAFQGIGSLAAPNMSYNPVGSDFNNQFAQQYMNPFIQQALNPQLDELRRQSQITQNQNDAKMTQAGAFGGSRQALMTTENQRNLMDQMDQTLGQGYSSAYDKAMAQFNADQQRKVHEAQYGSEYGLKGLASAQDLLNNQLRAGDVQRGIEQEGITADYNEFNKQAEFPYKQLQFQRDMISGLPASAVTSQAAQQSLLGQILSTVGGIGTLTGDGTGSITQLLKNLGID